LVALLWMKLFTKNNRPKNCRSDEFFVYRFFNPIFDFHFFLGVRSDWLYPPRPSYSYGSGVAGLGPGHHQPAAPPYQFPFTIPGFSETDIGEALRRSRQQGEANSRPRHHVINRRNHQQTHHRPGSTQQVTHQSSSFGFGRPRDDVVGMASRLPRRGSSVAGAVMISRPGPGHRGRGNNKRRALSAHDAYLHSMFRHDPYPPSHAMHHQLPHGVVAQQHAHRRHHR
jgi:hypothetical protein